MNTASQRVLVVIPAYNEAESLPGLIRELHVTYPAFDVLVVNDGSTDDTEAALSKLPARVISLPCNLGVGGAVQTAFMLAFEEEYDIAIQVDGDGQHPPGEIPKLLAAMEDCGADMVLGSRFLRADGYRSTRGRRLANRLFSCILSALTGWPITDATSGVRAWNRRAIRVLAKEYPEDYPEVEAILRLHQAGLRICEVSVNMLARTTGSSSIGSLEAITYMVKVPVALLMSLLRRRAPQSF